MMIPAWVIRECAEIDVGTHDTELAAVATAIYLEEALGVTLPSRLLDREPVGTPAEWEQTVRRLLGRD